MLFTSLSKKGLVDIDSCLIFSIFIKSLNISLEDILVADTSPSSTDE